MTNSDKELPLVQRLNAYFVSGGRYPGRAETRKVRCPSCGAESGKFCRRAGDGSARESNHQERVGRYLESIGAI